MPINVTLSEQNLGQALQLLDAAPGRVRIAVARAMNESIAWGRRELLRDLSGQTGLPQKVFSKPSRLKTGNATRAKMTAWLWYGANPVLADSLGLLVRVPGGVALDPTVRKQKGKAYFGGAFWTTIPGSGHSGYFMKSEPSPDATRASKRWTEGRAKTFGAENLPISKPTINLEPSPETVRRIQASINEQFTTRADRLLAWELEKTGSAPE
jgi:hypothetical protein